MKKNTVNIFNNTGKSIRVQSLIGSPTFDETLEYESVSNTHSMELGWDYTIQVSDHDGLIFVGIFETPEMRAKYPDSPAIAKE